MILTAEQLYELLPAIYRIRDADLGEPLRALVGVIAEQAAVMEADIARLYENWFIETCDEWVVPYIGAGLGVRGLHSLENAPFSQRAFVANTFGYRRRKGTATVLEQLARDTTGWNAHAVEFFKLLETTQHYNHIRLQNVRTPDLRDTNQLELIDTAFDNAAHTADVRRIAIGRGLHNIPNIGLFIWRLQSYFIPRAAARQLTSPNDGRYTVSPLGRDSALFNRPQAETDIAHLAEEINVPGLLRRRPLYDELERRRQAIADELGAAPFGMQPSLYDALARFRQAVIDEASSLAPFIAAVGQAPGGQTLLDELSGLLDDVPLPRAEIAEALRLALLREYHGQTFYFGPQPVLQIFIQYAAGAPFYEALPEEIQICTLIKPQVDIPEVWLRPAANKTYQPVLGDPQALPIKVAADPALGRLAFPVGVEPNSVKASYAYGFSGDLGGGPYNRRDSVLSILKHTPEFQRGVSKEIAPVPGKIVSTLGQAITDWNQAPGSVGVIAIMDSDTYEEDLTGPNRIYIPEGSQLLIVAAGWPEVPVPGDPLGSKKRVKGQLEPDDRRPHIVGSIEVEGTAPLLSDTPGELALNGLLIEGGVIVTAAATGNAGLGSLNIAHCTLVPGDAGLNVGSNNSQLRVTLLRSICGAIDVPNPVPSLRVEESIVDAVAAGTKAISAGGTKVEIEKSTVFGPTSALELEAGNSIFTNVVTITRRQVGCVRFSYVPDLSMTPRRFRCQPDLAVDDLPAAAQALIKARMAPSFTSEHYGHYAYAQLSQSCAVEVRTGAEDGSEMGVYSFLKQPQRITNLQTALDEYLRFGMEAGIILVT